MGKIAALFKSASYKFYHEENNDTRENIVFLTN